MVISQVVGTGPKKVYVLYGVLQHACWRVAYKAFLYQLLAMAMLHVACIEHVCHTPKNQQLELPNLKIIALKRQLIFTSISGFHVGFRRFRGAFFVTFLHK